MSGSMDKVNNAKKTKDFIKCTIEYNEYEASFNQRLWLQSAENLGEESKKANGEFVKNATVDYPP